MLQFNKTAADSADKGCANVPHFWYCLNELVSIPVWRIKLTHLP